MICGKLQGREAEEAFNKGVSVRDVSDVEVADLFDDERKAARLGVSKWLRQERTLAYEAKREAKRRKRKRGSNRNRQKREPLH
jgi:hypothetical protein